MKILFLTAALLFCTITGLSHAATISTPEQMNSAVSHLVAAAHKRSTLWPWEPAEPEVARVAAFGRAIAPLLVAHLANDPDNDDNVDWNVQQQLALALCRIYGIQPGPGRVYDNRAFPKTNRRIKPFWQHILAKP